MLRQRAIFKLDLGGVKIEQQADGTIVIFIQPEAYKVMTTLGATATSQSGHLYSQVVIAPKLNESEAASRETQLGLGG